MPPAATPDFIVIGRICRDVVPGSYVLGGAAASFIDGSVSNLILAYTSPDRG